MMNRGTFARVRQTALQGTALAMVGIGGPALVQTLPQSYNAGIPAQTSGNVSFQFGNSNETILVNTQTAVLDWTPTNTSSGTSPINFQNASTSMTYRGVNAAANGYTILNRIVPTGDATGRAIQFNGTVNSRLGDGTPGGSVWFYSPGGIFVGDGAVFDVGNLLLTTRDPINGASSISNPNSFAGGGTGGAQIYVAPTAQIRALAENSYIALVAPIVQMGGDVQINGQAAFVGAEQAQLTINNGLFDIVVTTGTDANAAFPVGVTGSVTGPASTSATDPHAIYVVAVPKNVVTTALINGTGTVGFATAISASIVNGRVVLSNGYNIAAGQVGAAANNGVAGDVHITGATFTSDVTASASRDASVFSYAGTTPQFARSLTIAGIRNSSLTAAQDGVTLGIGGNATLTTGGTLSVTNQALTATGGTAWAATETGGILAITGNLRLDSSVTAPDSTGPVAAQGGQARLYTNGGAITVGGATDLQVDAIGNATPVANRAGATLTAGLAHIYANSGNITLNGAVFMRAEARGTTSASTTAATATAGSLLVQTSNTLNQGNLTFGSNLYMLGRSYSDRSTIAGANGTAVGGDVFVQTRGGNMSVAGFLQLEASSFAGDTSIYTRPAPAAGSFGGDSLAGAGARIYNDAGVLSAQNVFLFATALGGENKGGGTGIGGTANGGLAYFQASGVTNVSGQVWLNSGATGGLKSAGTTGGGGVGNAGTSQIAAVAGTFNIGGPASVLSEGIGGSALTAPGGNGGAGNGGHARIGTGLTGGVLTVTGLTTANASGTGGTAANAFGAVGGVGTGGNGVQADNFQKGAFAVSQTGLVRLNGGASLSALGTGGGGPVGGAGVGGVAHYVSTGGVLQVTGNTTATVRGIGGNAVSGGGAGGQATGGNIFFTAEVTNGVNGRTQLGTVTFNAGATGGSGGATINNGPVGAGGSAKGGIITGYARASSMGITATSVTATSTAIGGVGGAAGTGTGGAGGAGTGGSIGFGTASEPNLPSNTGLANLGAVTIQSGGIGGAGGTGTIGGAGGVGSGGSVNVQARGTPVTIGTLSMSGNGQGGAGGVGTTTNGVGGNGVGGLTTVYSTNRYLRPERGLLTVGSASLNAVGIAGTGAPGATSTAGAGVIQITSGDATFASLSYTATGTQASAIQSSPLMIDVTDGTLGVTGALSLNSTGNAVVSARDGGAVSAASLNAVIRGNILPRPPEVPIGVPGTITTNGLQSWSVYATPQQFQTGDITLQSHLVAGGGLALHASRASLLNVTAGGYVDIGADNLVAGNIASANDFVALHTQDTDTPIRQVITGTISAPNDSISVDSGGIVTTGALFAGRGIRIDSIGAMTINGSAVANALGSIPNETASEASGLELYSDTSITTGNLTGLFVEVTQGELNDDGTPNGTPGQVTVGNVSAEAMKIVGIGNVTTGNLTVADIYQYLTIDSEQYDLPILFAGALGNLVTGNATGTDFGLFAAGGNLTTGNLSFTGSVAITAGQNATIGSITTGTGVNDLFYAGNTSVLFDDPLIAPYFSDLLELEAFDSPATPFSPSLLLTSTLPAMGGALTVGNMTTGTFRAAAATASVAGINASQRVNLTTSGLASVSGLIASPLIDIRSSDIAIGNAGAIGNASTTFLTLRSNGPAVTIGGQDSGEGYVLSDAEAGRLTAATITVVAPGAVTLRDLNLRGSGAQQPNLIGGAGAFRVSAVGPLRVTGAVKLTDAASNNLITLASNQRIEVPTDLGGSFTLTGAQPTALSGSLALSAPVVAVATNNILAQMAQDPRYAGRDAALATPAGNRPEGFLQAGRITLTSTNVIAIQNSNTTALMGGFTTGSGGMTVAILNQEQAGQPVDVRIYGRTTAASGAFVTNGDTLATVTRTPNNGTFSATSAVNGCLFTATSCAPPPVTPVDPVPNNPENPSNPSNPSVPSNDTVPISPTIVALVSEATDGEPVQAASVPAIRIMQMLDDTAIVEDAMITDPVAGSANASVWDAGTDEDDDADGADGKGDDATPAAPAAGGGK